MSENNPWSSGVELASWLMTCSLKPVFSLPTIGIAGIFLLGAAACCAGANVIWQLGHPDGDDNEFIVYNSGEFRTSRQIADSPGYNQELKEYFYRVPSAGITASPRMPGGISGGHAGNNSLVCRQVMEWEEEMTAIRELEIVLMPGSRDFRKHRVNPNENMDIDGTDIPRAGLRIEAPDGRVYYRYLPADLEQQLGKDKSVIIRLNFMVSPGANRVTVMETSGDTYGRVYRFDCITLKESDGLRELPPVVEYRPVSGFREGHVYVSDHDAELEIGFSNLLKDRDYQIRVEWLNYFGKAVKTDELSLRGTGAPMPVRLGCPSGETGHFRVRTWIRSGGKALKLQMDQDFIETRLAAFRMIEPLDDVEIERSFIGLCGLTQSAYFDPVIYPRRKWMEQYRAYRRLLQIHHERIHSLMWQFLERKENEFDWEYWDSLMRAEKEDRIWVQLCVLGTPEWLFRKHRPDAKTGHLAHIYFSVPPDLSKWGEVCAMIAQRYRGVVREMELWNEPSEQSHFWHSGTAEDYFKLVKAGSEAVKAAVPEMKIVAESVWSRQLDFSLRLYEMGIGKYIDYAADHYMNDERIRMVKGILNRHGHGDGLLCNEAKSDRAGPLGQIDEDNRKQAARSLFRNYLYNTSQGILRTYNFMLQSMTWRIFGKIGPDNTPKYTLSVMKTLNNRFTGASFVLAENDGAGLESYVFKYFSPARIRENGGESIVALVNNGSEEREVKLFAGCPKVRVVDLMDNSREVYTDDGMLRLTLGRDPVMVVGIDLKTLEDAAALKVKVAEHRGKNPRMPELCLSLDDKPSIRGAIVSAGLEGRDGKVEATLRPGESKVLPMPVIEGLRDGVYRLDISGNISTDAGVIPMRRGVSMIIASLGSGENLLPPWSDREKSWRRWGQAALEFPSSDSARINVNGTGALTSVKTLPVIPGQPYHAEFCVRGKGMLRVMLETYDGEGKILSNQKNFISGELDELWRKFSVGLTTPHDAAAVRLHLYQWNSQGWLEAGASRFIRLEPSKPLNRQLFLVEAPRRKGIVVDGSLDEWKDAKWIQAGDRVGSPGKNMAAEFSLCWDNNTVFVALVVKDDTHHPVDGENLWQGDSVQFSFEPGNHSNDVPSAQFGISSGGICRYEVVPTEDIIESYRVGSCPAGVKAVVRRDDGMTVYEVALPAAAIWPIWHISPGTECGFSLLINDNDGSGRKGWLQWSDGIGSRRASSLFGSVVFVNN